jgi:hypothetical protein
MGLSLIVIAHFSPTASIPQPFLSNFWIRHLQNKMSDRKAVIKNADMSEDMQQDAIDCAMQVCFL